MLFQEFKQRYARPLFHFSPWKLIGTRSRDATNCVLNYCNRTIDICSLIFSCSCEELCPSSAAPKTVRLYLDTLKITPFLIMPFPSKITKLLDQCQYFSDCAPTPPLTKHIPLLFISWLLFGSGRGGCAVTQILTLIFINDRRGVLHMTENPTTAVPNYHLSYQIVFWDSLPLPCNGVGHHTLEVRCLNWAYFSWESHSINFSLLLRYELLTPGVIPKGFMDGRKACQKMVCRFADFTLFIKLPYFSVQFSIDS